MHCTFINSIYQIEQPRDVAEMSMPHPEAQKRSTRRAAEVLATLTAWDVAQIKAHLQQGKSQKILARYFPANRTTISAIRDNKTYRHVAPAEKARPLSELSKRL